jgi:hypothetical protein
VIRIFWRKRRWRWIVAESGLRVLSPLSPRY